jgi:uncharacterized protein YjeT (DUF2065 family)
MFEKAFMFCLSMILVVLGLFCLFVALAFAKEMADDWGKLPAIIMFVPGFMGTWAGIICIRDTMKG